MDMLNLCQNTPKVKTVYGTAVSLRDAQGKPLPTIVTMPKPILSLMLADLSRLTR